MANSIARQFLNDSSKQLLEKSEGTKAVVKKLMAIDRFNKVINERKKSIKENNVKINNNSLRINEINKMGFFVRLANLSGLRKEKSKLAAENEFLSQENFENESIIANFEDNIEMLEGEIEAYARDILTPAGVTPEEIMSEYVLILKELDEKEKMKDKGVVQKTSVKPQVENPSSAVEESNQNCNSQLYKFKARLAKTEEIKKRRNASNQSDSQPGNND